MGSYLSPYYVKQGCLYALTVSLRLPCVVLGYSAQLNEFFFSKKSLTFSLTYHFSQAVHAPTWIYRGFFSWKCYILFLLYQKRCGFSAKNIHHQGSRNYILQSRGQFWAEKTSEQFFSTSSDFGWKCLRVLPKRFRQN